MQRPSLSSTAHYVAWYASQTPDATAVLEAGTSIPYRKVAADLLRCVAMLERRAVMPGYLVGIAIQGRYLNLLLLLACEVIGATSASLSQARTSPDDPVSRHCHCIVTNTCQATRDDRIVSITAQMLDGGSLSLEADRGLSRLGRPTAPTHVSRIIRTSGSTGQPKAMPLLATTQQRRITRMIDRVAREVLPNPRFLCLYPLAMNGVCMRAFGALQHGGTVVFAIEAHASGLISVGAVNYSHLAVGDCERIAQQATHPPDGHVFHLEIFGAAVAGPLRELIDRKLRAVTTVNYSSNEASSIATMDRENIGAPCAGVELRIVDAHGRDLPSGETGLIRIRSETMVQNYFEAPDLTAAAFLEGWFQSRDVGRLTDDGRLVVLGRDDDMLNIGGIKVARLPLEADLRRVPGIRDAVVFSASSPNRVGRLVVAVETDACSDEVMRGVTATTARQVGTCEIMPLRWFPRSETGKVRRAEVEALFDCRRTPADRAIALPATPAPCGSRHPARRSCKLRPGSDS